VTTPVPSSPTTTRPTPILPGGGTGDEKTEEDEPSTVPTATRESEPEDATGGIVAGVVAFLVVAAIVGFFGYARYMRKQGKNVNLKNFYNLGRGGAGQSKFGAAFGRAGGKATGSSGRNDEFSSAVSGVREMEMTPTQFGQGQGTTAAV